MPFLDRAFDLVCASPNVWAPGGVALPFCQRCSGLYLGAVIALGVYAWLRPRATRALVLLNGGFLVGMIPFGYQWVAHGPWVRTATGLAFAFGLVFFLSLPGFRRLGQRGVSAGWVIVALCVALPSLLAVLNLPSSAAASVLAWTGLLGLGIYALLLVSNAALLCFELGASAGLGPSEPPAT